MDPLDYAQEHSDWEDAYAQEQQQHSSGEEQQHHSKEQQENVGAKELHATGASIYNL